jgi:hypothetical protein
MATNPQRSDAVLVVRVRNQHDHEMRFLLEPWGEEYPMPADARFDVIAQGPTGGALDIELSAGTVTVHGWSGSVIRLSHDGVELGAGLGPRTDVPPTPEPPSAR